MSDLLRDAPDGYTLGKRLHASPHSEVYEAVRDTDRLDVVLKGYLDDGVQDRKPRAQREFDALRRISSDGVPRALDVDRSRQRPLLVLERLPGVSLARLLDEVPLALEAWLALAVQLAQTLTAIHAARILHKDLKPSNVLLERRTGKAWIIDFGVAAELGSAERPDQRREEAVEGTLLYIPPEQTGWIKRGCDFRSDLYALGATLYHAWTGSPPFAATTPHKLIHEHIARVPPAPDEVRQGLPPALSRLVLKLLRKEPDERYSSARALHADLAACREQLASTGTIRADFELAASETPDRPRFLPRLYGRQREIGVLREAFARASGGRTQAVMIAGAPGVGKSALVHELGLRTAESSGYLVAGKFDLYRDRPHSGWATALGALVERLLVESDEHLARWKRELREGLGSIARALVDLVPDLEFILGEVPPVPTLGPRETQARLSLALQRFLKVCARPEHPLAIFLDDLQWSDAGSRALLEELLGSETPCALLLLGAYRASDVEAGHPLALLFERLAKLGVPIESIQLQPLSREGAVEMLAETLQRRPEEVTGLTDLIERKTGNSPLLVRHFVEHVRDRGLLRFERGTGWCWDLPALDAADIPDGAVALMTAKIGRLDGQARSVLQFASCVGDEFDAEMLAELGRERAALDPALDALCDAGLIAPCPNGFRFAHARIREAAQALLSDEERGRLHYQMARFLLERFTEAERPDHVFEIVEHLNRGLENLPEELRCTAIELNVLGGKIALSAGAAGTASGLLSVAQTLFREGDWAARRELCFELHLYSAESAFQNGKFDETLAWLDSLERSAASRTEFAQVAVKRIKVLALLRSPEESARSALAVLERLGVRWPQHPSRLRAALEVRMVRWMLRLKRGEPLQPARKVDPDWLVTLAYINASGGVTARIDVYLSMLATCLVMRHNLRHGYVGAPGFTLGAHALYDYVMTLDGRMAGRLRDLSLHLNERAPDPLYSPRNLFQVHVLLEPYLMRRRQALASSEQIAEMAREVGDREFEYYSRFVEANLRALGGEAVGESERRLRALSEAVSRSGHNYPVPAALHQVYRLLLQERIAPQDIDRQQEENERWIAAHPGSGDIYVRTLWMMVLCVYGHHERALAQSDLLGERLFRVVPFVHVPDHTFYRGLAAASLAEDARGAVQRRYRRVLRRALGRLRAWARSGPDFVHMVGLLDAERARLRGDHARARSLYEQAAQRARRQDFIHHAALAHERRASMLTRLRRDTEAAQAVRATAALYEEWGAAAKATELTSDRR